MISLPFIAIHEIGVATWNAIYRDLGWSDVSNKVVPESKEAISIKIAALEWNVKAQNEPVEISCSQSLTRGAPWKKWLNPALIGS